MKFKTTLLFILVIIFYACGPKVGKGSNELLNDIRSYVSEIDSNKRLKSELTEGVLTDTEGINDIGTFKFTVYYDYDTKELFKIKNVETTDKTISETYYFENKELVYLQSVLGRDIKNIYLKKDRVVSESNTTSEDQQLLLSKAKRFQKSFMQNH